jgi:ATP-binding cassette, subfamily F, member 3
MASLISGKWLRKLTFINEGVGKSTLLRHIAMREVPIPPHITILFVEQEVKIVSPAPAVPSHDLPDCWR